MISVFSSPEVIANFALENDMCLSDVRKAQACRLYCEYELPRREVADITGYARSTLSKMKNNLSDYSSLAVALFGEVDSVPENEVCEIVVEIPAVRTVMRRHGGVEIPMNFLPGCGDDVPGQNTVYLIKFYTDNRETPVFSKIGTTERTVEKRLRDEIAYYRKRGFDIQSTDICKIVDCGTEKPERLESFLRAVFMGKYGEAWHKNDRFFGIDIPIDYFCQTCDMMGTI
jgi:hypothetical protein